MRIKLDAKVRTKDGHDAGRVKRAIWDPASNGIRDFVVTTGGLLGHEVVVSRELLERGRHEADDVVVDLTSDEFRALERYDEKGYATPPIGWTPPALYDLPAAGYLVPVEPVDAAEAARPRRPAIRKGQRVKDTDGGDLGTVREVRVDDMTGELRSIVVERAPVVGEGERFEVPADHVDVGDDEVHLVEGAGTSPRAPASDS